MIREPLASPVAKTAPHDAAEPLDDVRGRITAFFEGRVRASERFNPALATLWRISARAAADGKCFRPALLLESYRAFAEDVPIPEAVLELATATELLHLAFLTHDDVIDNDIMRRGTPNLLGSVEEMLGAEEAGYEPSRTGRLGQTAAILVGDLLLSEAHLRIARADLALEQRRLAFDELEHALAVSVAGEYSDVRLAVREANPTLEEVLEMSTQKTAAYTVHLPLKLGLIAAGAHDRVDAALVSQFSDAAGLAFQLQDDILGVFGNQLEIGKPPHSDIREGKFTALIAVASRTDSWPGLKPLLGKEDLSAAEGERARTLLEASGARAEVEAELDRQFESARAAIAAIAAGPDAGSDRLAVMLERLLKLLEGRTS